MPFVVKKGSKILARVSSSMPEPSSETPTQTYRSSLASGKRARRRSPAATSVASRNVPPWGIASRAFTARLRSAWWSWFASAVIGGTSGASSSATRTDFGNVSPIIVASSVTTELTSTDSNLTASRFANVRSCRTSAAPR